MTTAAAAAVAAPSTPHLHRLEQLESPNSRYAGRRVAHIDTPTAQLAAPSASSLLSPKPPKHSRSLAFAASPPLVKRSRSAEQSDDDAVDDDEFLLSVAQENAAARRDVDDVFGAGDRFIPPRTRFDVDVANYNLRLDDVLTSGSLDTSPAKEQYKRTLNAQLFGGRARSHVLSHDDHANASTASAALLDTMPRSAFGSPQKKCHRSIPRTPLRILDAPEMLEDYYLNLLDWSRRNVIVVALARSVYLWNASCGEITKLMELDAAESCITSVRWTETGEHLAVGTSDCDVQLWDATTLKRVRRMRGHQGRVSVLAWHGHQLASGSRDATVHVHDVRAATHVAQTLSKHTQEVCGLAWSADGILASGGNDNLINLWEPARAVTPRHTLAHHTAAVKGLAWCPWQQNLLASGGGTADRTIRFWDVSNGACLNAIDTKSQVCAILWSSHYRELVSSHGFSQNQLIVWQYPSMVKVCELTGHTSRVLHMAMSPDGETVVSASGDETLRFWRVFERRRPSVSLGAAEQRATELALPSMSIR